MTTRRWLLLAIATAALVLLIGRVVAGVYVDYRWYEALGATPLWLGRLQNLAILRFGFGVLGTLFMFANLYAVRQSVVSLVLPRRVANLEIGEEVPGRYLMGVVIALSVIVGALLAAPQDDWVALAQVRWGERFRESDPHFEADLATWVYWLPFEQAFQVWALIALLVATTLVVFLYALTPSLRWERGSLYVSGYVRRHLTSLGAMLLVLLAWSYRLDAYGLLIEGTGQGGVFTSFDHRPGIPVNLLLAFVTATLAAIVLWSGWVGQMRIAFAAVTIVLALSLGLRQLLPPISQRMAGSSDPEARERGYLATRAVHTRRAYDIDRLVRDDTSGAFATLADLPRAVSSWDPAALARAVERRRAGKVNGGIGWAADSARLVALAVQQPVGPDGVDPFTPWALTRAVAGAADRRGGLVAPGGSADEGLTIEPALVHDSAAGYLVVPERVGDVAAPEIMRWPSLLAHAWDQQNLRLLFSDTEVREPRMLLHRDVRSRVERLAPFFRQGTRVSPIIHRDSLYWVLHLYSTSASYPLSERLPFGDDLVSYVRHAATALVQAHSGRVTIVPDSVLDPIARTWAQRFPTLFTPWHDLPSDLAERVPPPIDAAMTIALAFARVGARGELAPSAHLPRSFGGDTLFAAQRWSPYLEPGTNRLAWAVPLLDAADRLRGVVIADGGAQWTVRWRPLSSPGPRWPSVVDQLQRLPDANTGSPRDVALKRGPVRAIPLRGGVALLQSTYAWRAEGPPVLTRVAVFARDTMRAGATLADAVGAADDAGIEEPRAPATPAEFRERVAQLYDVMRDALRRGDWRAYGEAFEELGRLLRPVEGR